MEKNLKRKSLALALTASLVGAAIFAATPTAMAATSHALPVQVYSHTYQIPGGVVRVETMTWGTTGNNAPTAVVEDAGVPGGTVRVIHLNPAAAQALEARTLEQVRDMEIGMQEQMATMQHLMAMAFSEPWIPMAQPTVPVLWNLPPMPALPWVQPTVPQVAPKPVAPTAKAPVTSCRWNLPAPTHASTKTPV